MKVVHVITGLSTGGAERFLLRLLQRMPAEFEFEVISLTGLSPIGDEIRALGIPVHALGMKPGRPSLRGFLTLMRLLRDARADLVHTWMYHSDLLGGLAARIVGKPAIWCVRLAHRPNSAYYRPSVMVVVRLNALLSRFVPRAIICCGLEVAKSHSALGYDPKKLVTVANGVSLDLFRPFPSDGMAVRAELGIDKDSFVIGMVGRVHPQKNHAVFFQMARRLLAKGLNLQFVIAGPGVAPTNDEIRREITDVALNGRLHLLGDRRDIARVLNAIDILVNPSNAEGFPNVVAEAMATGIPCVVTDVGDSALIVGTEGIVVPAGDLEGLSASVTSLYSLSKESRIELGRKARLRITDHFSLESAVRGYVAVYESIA